jgi:uncharacterized membrane protein YjfL (UPF0719 family)
MHLLLWCDSALTILFQHLVAALVFSTIGIGVFALGIWIVAKVLPFSLRKELEEDHNTAVAIIVGAMLIGISMIIAAAIQG